MADLAEIEAMIEAALPGASVEILDEAGAGDHLRATVAAPQFEGAISQRLTSLVLWAE